MGETAEHRAAGQDPADHALAVDPVREVPHPAEPGADSPVGEPGAAVSSGVDPVPGAAGGPAPGAGEGPGSFPPGSAALDQPRVDGAAGVRPSAAFGEDAASVVTPSDGSTQAGVVATPLGPSPGNTAQFPATAGAVPPPPGWYPAASGTPPYADGPPLYPPPYPQGPYPQGPYPLAPSAAPPTAPPPRRGPSWAAPAPSRTHRWGLGAFLLAWSVFMAVSLLIGIYVTFGGAPRTASTLVIALAVPTVLAAGIALLITRVRGNGPRTDLRLVWSWRDLGMGLAFGFGGLALTIPASVVYVAIVGEDATSAVGEEFAGIRAGPALAILVLVTVVFVAPTCEEILYRGLLWGGLEKIAGRWVAFAVSTLLFAIAHFEITRTPLLLVVAIPIAFARLYTGRLLASIVAHQINNLLPGIALLLGLLGVIPMA